MWQDWIITGAQLVFIASLIPSIIHPTKKPTVSTSLPTACGLFVIAATYASLELWFSAGTAGAMAIGWTVLAYQRWKLDKTG